MRSSTATIVERTPLLCSADCLHAPCLCVPTVGQQLRNRVRPLSDPIRSDPALSHLRSLLERPVCPSAVPEGVGPGDEFEVLLDDVEASEEVRIVTEDDQMIEGEAASRVYRACCFM